MGKSQFLTSIRDYMQVRRYSKRTIDSYLAWIKAFILFHGKKHPEEMGEREVEAFLTHLAVNQKVSASTQSLALNALAFLYNKFLEQPLVNAGEFRRARKQAKLPVVLTQEEVGRLLKALFMISRRAPPLKVRKQDSKPLLSLRYRSPSVAPK